MSTPETACRYFVSHNGAVQGPFDLDLIEAMILSGHYGQSVPICAEGSQEWKNHSLTNQVLPPPLPKGSVRSTSPTMPTRTPKWVFWLVGIVGVLILVIALINNSSSSSSSSNLPSVAPSYQPNHSTSTAPTYSPFTAAPAPELVLYTDSQGRKFRVPYDQSVRISQEYHALRPEQNSIEAIKSKLNAESNNIELERASLDRNNPYAVMAFNQRVDSFNAENDRLKEQITRFNRKVNDIDWELHTVGSPVP